MQPPVPQMVPAVAAAAYPDLWVSHNGGVVQMAHAQYAALPPETSAMPLDQLSGWKTLAVLAPAAAAPAHVPPAAGGFAGRSAPTTAAPASGVPRGAFAGVEGAEVTRKGNNINEGDYVVRICSAEYKTARTATFVIIEVEIIDSSYSETDPAKQGCNREGSRATIFIKKNDSFANNIKEVLLAISGFDAQGDARDVHDQVSQAECEALVSAEQPYTGVLVYLEARGVITKQNQPFTRVSWWPCPALPDGKPDHDKLFTEVR